MFAGKYFLLAHFISGGMWTNIRRILIILYLSQLIEAAERDSCRSLCSEISLCRESTQSSYCKWEQHPPTCHKFHFAASDRARGFFYGNQTSVSIAMQCIEAGMIYDVLKTTGLPGNSTSMAETSPLNGGGPILVPPLLFFDPTRPTPSVQ